MDMAFITHRHFYRSTALTLFQRDIYTGSGPFALNFAYCLFLISTHSLIATVLFRDSVQAHTLTGFWPQAFILQIAVATWV